MGGGTWQTHRSGWMPSDFDGRWTCFVCPDFHTLDHENNTTEAFGAFWALLNKFAYKTWPQRLKQFLIKKFEE